MLESILLCSVSAVVTALLVMGALLLPLTMAVAVAATCLYQHQQKKKHPTTAGANTREETVRERYYDEIEIFSPPVMKENQSYGKLAQ